MDFSPEIKVDKWLEVFEMSEILEQADITEAHVLMILYNHGYIELPEWLAVASAYEENEEDVL